MPFGTILVREGSIMNLIKKVFGRVTVVGIALYLGAGVLGAVADAGSGARTLRGRNAQGDAYQVELECGTGKQSKSVHFRLTFTELSEKTVAFFHDVEKASDSEMILKLSDREGSVVAKVHCPLYKFKYDQTGLNFQGEVVCNQEGFLRISSATVS